MTSYASRKVDGTGNVSSLGGAGIGSAAGEAERAGQVVDMRAGEIEATRDLHDVPARILERLAKQSCLETARRLLERERRTGPDVGSRGVGKQMALLDLARPLAGGANGRGLDRVCELSHVPRPL